MARRLAFFIGFTTLLAGCGPSAVAPDHYLDPQTAVTLTAMPEPWVYAHEEPMFAAHARDYANLGVVESNRAGAHSFWLGVVEWSTIDRSQLGLPMPDAAATLELEWPDHEVIQLAPAPHGRRAVGTQRAYFAPPHAPGNRESWYELAPDQLRRLNAQPPVRVVVRDASGRERAYATWQVDGATLEAVVGKR